jgi:hypothetical protein
MNSLRNLRQAPLSGSAAAAPEDAPPADGGQRLRQLGSERTRD